MNEIKKSDNELKKSDYSDHDLDENDLDLSKLEDLDDEDGLSDDEEKSMNEDEEDNKEHDWENYNEKDNENEEELMDDEEKELEADEEYRKERTLKEPKKDTENIYHTHEDNEDLHHENLEPSYPPKDRSRLKRFLIPIFIIIAIFIVYKILGWIGSRHAPEKPTPTPTVATATATPGAQIAVPPPPPTPEEIMMQKIDTLTQEVNQHQDQINSMKTTLDDNQKTLTNLNQSLGTLNTSIDELTAKIDNLQKPQIIRTRAVRKTFVIPKTAYHIKAILPGRAWLEDCRGRTITVRQGDIVNGGRVELISQSQGIVALSTGEIIQYGSNDF